MPRKVANRQSTGNMDKHTKNCNDSYSGRSRTRKNNQLLRATIKHSNEMERNNHEEKQKDNNTETRSYRERLGKRGQVTQVKQISTS